MSTPETPADDGEDLSGLAGVDPSLFDDDSVGLRDMFSDGWFNTDAGELAPGFPIAAGEVVLDIGCGDGFFSSFCAKRGAELILADIDGDALAKARVKMAEYPDVRLTTLETDANPIPLPDASVDVVMALEVLEHVEDPDAFMRELVRVAKPGARFLLAVPGEFSERLQQGLAPDSYFSPPNHIRIFRDGELAQLAERHGLIDVRSFSRGFFNAMWWIFFWACEQQDRPPWHPLLRTWNSTWSRLLETQEGMRIKNRLDGFMPKSLAIAARKPEV